MENMTSHSTASMMSWITPRARNNEHTSLPRSNSAILVSRRNGNANPAMAATSHTTKFSTTSTVVATTASLWPSAHCRASSASSRQLSATWLDFGA